MVGAWRAQHHTPPNVEALSPQDSDAVDILPRMWYVITGITEEANLAGRVSATIPKEQRTRTTRPLTAEESLARVLLEAGIRFATAFPGLPTHGIMERMSQFGWASDCRLAWASSPRSAIEQAHGASLAGCKTVAILSGTALTEAYPSVVAAARIGIGSGLLLIVGDDPGGWDSFAEVDCRPLLASAGVPIFEPSRLEDVYGMIPEALRISRAYDVPVALRVTSGFMEEESLEQELPVQRITHQAPFSPGFGPERLALPAAATLRRSRQLARLEHLQHASRFSRFVDATGAGSFGVVGVGHAYAKLTDVLGEGTPEKLRLLKLGQTFPIPDYLLLEFIDQAEEVLVLEEGDPFVEQELRSLLAEHVAKPKVHGKLSGALPREGELQRWQTEEALRTLIPGLSLDTPAFPLGKRRPRPSLASVCLGCPLATVRDALHELRRSEPDAPLVVGDHGCLLYLTVRGEEKLVDVLAAPGSAFRIAAGYTRASTSRPVLALTGDYSLLGRGIGDLADPECHQLPITLLILNNGASAYTGGPSCSFPQGLALEDVLGSVQPPVLRVLEQPSSAGLVRTVTDCLSAGRLAVVLVKYPCIVLEEDVD